MYAYKKTICGPCMHQTIKCSPIPILTTYYKDKYNVSKQ